MTGQAPICPTCSTAARLTDGREVYPNHSRLADKPVWVCTVCEDTYCGCHPGTEDPLGTPAGAELRKARMILHQRSVDPLWKTAPETEAYGYLDEEGRKTVQRAARARVYRFLANRMGLTEEQCHIGMFTLEQCREAWRVLRGVDYVEIRQWAKLGDRQKPKRQRIVR